MNIDFSSLGVLFITIFFMYILHLMSKKNIDFGIKNILAMGIGLILGLIFQGKMTYVAPIGKIYVNLIISVVVPLLFVSIISSICSLEDITKLKSIGIRAISWLLLNTTIAALIGIVLGVYFNIGNGMEITVSEEYSAREVPAFIDVIIGLFPNNIVSNSANNEIVPIIIFSILIGLSVVILSNKNTEITEPFKSLIDSFQAIINTVVDIIVSFTPYAVLSLIANAVSNNGTSKLLPLISILGVSYLACLIQLFIVSGGFILIFAKLNPIKFFKNIWTCIVVAFTSQSSMGTLPVTLDCLNNKVGVNKNISAFTAPLGSTMGMPGCAGIWPAILAITAINILGLDYSITQYIELILIILIVSVGTVGVPGTATITTTAVFTAAGLPVEIIVITTPISVIVDMIRTATNVTNAATVTVLVAKSQNEINLDVFNS